LQYDLLQALRSLKAIDPEKQAYGPEIADRVGGDVTGQSVKAPLADLKERGFAAAGRPVKRVGTLSEINLDHVELEVLAYIVRQLESGKTHLCTDDFFPFVRALDPDKHPLAILTYFEGLGLLSRSPLDPSSPAVKSLPGRVIPAYWRILGEAVQMHRDLQGEPGQHAPGAIGRQVGGSADAGEAGEGADESAELVAEEPAETLTGRARLILETMLEHEITSERRRKKRADIVRLINRTHKSQTYGRVFSDLVKRGYLRSLEGHGGGYWLAPAGRAEAERLHSSN
jgi:hypothetical protein